MNTPVPVHTLRLVLGDQLNPLHRWWQQPDPGILHVLMEVRSETDYVRHHAQKIIALFAAMEAFVGARRAEGHRMRHVRIDDPSNRQSICANLEALQAHYQAPRIEYQAPDEWRLDQALAAWSARMEAQGVTVEMVDSEHFLAPRDAVGRFFAQRREWRMEHFYRAMRQQWQVLLDARGKPEGGQWNFDQENRKRWPGTPPEPADLRPRHDHRAIWARIQAAGVDSFGQPCAEALRWPLDRREALVQLDDFIAHGLPHFGDYQDALSASAPRLFHSLLSFALNTKMLHPREVIQRAEDAWRAGTAPLPAVEGFIRQILGWREYVRGVYWAQMPDYAEHNFFGHTRPLPGWFWTGTTRMACLARAVGDSLAHAYAHHIQRLMVISNFALLAGLDPAGVHRWYLGVYIDAFEWVELPNTLGMGQFADGGLLASKPYVSSGAYLDRMGDHCRQCSYAVRQRTGPGACPFNALYWDFFMTHRPRLEGNPRLGLVFRQVDKMGDAERAALRDYAAALRANIETL
ncbi:MAG: cryptochrome/photolyase family protein [Rhodocyclales bacterium]|nr:cryptochrome/photolyase family protein [Rhodocyclales bacterium]